jgi:hypothetical protein
MTSMRTSRFSAYVGGQWHRPFDDVANDRTIAAQGKIPRWTPEDETNLARRVRRLAAKHGHTITVEEAD